MVPPVGAPLIRACLAGIQTPRRVALGWLVGLGALVLPGIGPFMGAGVLVAMLGGAAIGAGVGAIAGALIRMGIPEHEARYNEDEVRKGRTLVTVGGGRNQDADRIMHNYGGYDAQHPERASTSIPVR
jgi:uncharacterized membrane protein